MVVQNSKKSGKELTLDLSIVIVNWNTKDMTRDCLASVRAGLGSLAAEVIVIDNSSSDGSADMIATEFPEFILIRNSENRGFAAANNQGFEVAHGRHVLLLNTDTLIHGIVLPASVAWLDTHSEVGAMGCRVLNTDGSVQLTCSMYPSILNQLLQLFGFSKFSYPQFFGRYIMKHWLRDSEKEVEVISGCYLLVRRDVISQVGQLDESFFFFGEETDWCKRMRDAGWHLMFAPVGEITHHGSISARKLNHLRDVMLSEAIVRLHRKHSGLIGGLLAFGVIIMFNATRALYWSLATVFAESEHARERGRHFRAVLAASNRIWPKSVGTIV